MNSPMVESSCQSSTTRSGTVKVKDLEEDNAKLKDVLYGCCECGLYNCECSDAENRDDNDKS